MPTKSVCPTGMKYDTKQGKCVPIPGFQKRELRNNMRITGTKYAMGGKVSSYYKDGGMVITGRD